jgi:hypothetical protein
MPYQTIARSQNFIDSVAITPRAASAAPRRGLAATVPSAPVELQDKAAQAVVAGAGLILAEEGVTKQVKEDLLTCTLFAQFAASSSVSTAKKSIEWYDAYFEALRNLGCAMSSQDFGEHRESGNTLQVHKAILTVLTALLGPAATALAVAKAVLSGLEEAGSDHGWLTLFNRDSVNASVAKFQVITAQPAKDGQINIALVAFELRARKTLTQVFFVRFAKSSVHLRFSGGSATIFEPALADVRASLQKKLAAVTANFVDSITIPASETKGRIGVKRSTRI